VLWACLSQAQRLSFAVAGGDVDESSANQIAGWYFCKVVAQSAPTVLRDAWVQAARGAETFKRGFRCRMMTLRLLRTLLLSRHCPQCPRHREQSRETNRFPRLDVEPIDPLLNTFERRVDQG
jgi:hypothetical protein